MKIKIIHLLFLLSITSQTYAQLGADSIALTKNDSITKTVLPTEVKFKPQSIIIPASLIGFGVLGLGNNGVRNLNEKIRDKFVDANNAKTSLDDYIQYAPFASVYAINVLGVKGKHNFKDRTIILATACMLMGVTTYTLKYTTNSTRPDNSANNSFPSRHTATAFMGAEFLYQEYKDVSPWYGIGGYLVAAGTGYLRMQNNRHWLTDVVAGAGVGILSTKAAYWLYPLIKEKIFKNNKSKLDAVALPYYNGNQAGLSLVMKF